MKPTAVAAAASANGAPALRAALSSAGAQLAELVPLGAVAHR